jgi:hypothetical protein
MAKIIDQQNLLTADGIIPLRYGATTNVKIGQSIVPTQSNIAEVHLLLANIGGTTGNVWVEIYSDSSDLPSTLLGTSATVACSGIQAAPPNYPGGEVTFTFTSPVPVTPGVKCHIVLAGDYAVSSTVNIGWSRDTVNNTYASGNLTDYTGSTWELYSANDAWFKEYYTPSSGFFAFF